MNKKFIAYSIMTFTMLSSFNCFAQKKKSPRVDPTTLSPNLQILNGDIQVVDLLKYKKNTPRMMELIPTLSQFQLAQLDSVDVFNSHRDSTYFTVYAQNEEFKGINTYCAVYKNGKIKTILTGVNLQNNPNNKWDKYNRLDFEYLLETKPVERKLGPKKGARLLKGTRYILKKKHPLKSELKKKKEEKSLFDLF